MATFEQLAAATETNTGFADSIGEYRGAFDVRRFTFAAGAVLALVGCTSGDVTPVTDERVNVAANVDPNCNPEDIDFSKESADKNFDAADGVFPSMPGSASKKAEAVKTLQEATLTDGRIAGSVDSLISTYESGVAKTKGLTTSGLRKNVDLFKADTDRTKERTVALCVDFNNVVFHDSVAAPVGGVKIAFERDKQGVTSYAYEQYVANDTLDNVWQLKGNTDDASLTPQQRAFRDRDIYVTSKGEVIVLGATLQEGTAKVDKDGKEVKATDGDHKAANNAGAQGKTTGTAAENTGNTGQGDNRNGDSKGGQAPAGGTKNNNADKPSDGEANGTGPDGDCGEGCGEGETGGNPGGGGGGGEKPNPPKEEPPREEPPREEPPREEPPREEPPKEEPPKEEPPKEEPPKEEPPKEEPTKPPMECDPAIDVCE